MILNTLLRLRVARWCMALPLALAAPAWAQSTNADLSGLTLSSGALLPAFSPGQPNYSAQVSHPTTGITVTPTLADGTATVTVNGAPVTSGAPSAPIALNVGANTITAQVTAQDGTTVKPYTVTVTRAAHLTVSLSTVNATCSTGGQAEALPSGGVPPYAYGWQPSGETGKIVNNLEAGNYTVTVTDSLGSTTTATASIATTNTLVATTSQTNPLTNASNNGSASVTPSGAPGPFSYVWSPPVGATSTAANLAVGNYSVTITANNGCSIVKHFTLSAPPPWVESVTVPVNGTYGTGSTLHFTVNYNAPIAVDTVGGTPAIPLTIGSATRHATYASGTDTQALVFAYTVQPGDLDTDGIAVGGAIAPNGGSLSDADLTLNGLGSLAGVLVQQQTASGQGVELAIANPGPACALTGATAFALATQLPLVQRQALPQGYSYPFAAVDFAANPCQPGSNLAVTLTYPSTVPQNAKMLKWDGAAWQPFTPDAINGTQVIYNVLDNGPLDTNKTAGQFADPALLAVPLAAQAVPTLGEWALALLSTLLAALVWRRRAT